MLEKKINNLKSAIFIRCCIYSFVIIILAWCVFMIRDEYTESVLRFNSASAMVNEMNSKLREITGDQSLLDASVSLYNTLQDRSEDDLCREYQKLISRILELNTKHNLTSPIKANLSTKSTKYNMEHNKKSYIAQHDLKIEFNSYNINDAVDIFSDISSMLPKNSLIYLVESRETAITPKNIIALSDNAKPFLISNRIYVKLRSILLNK